MRLCERRSSVRVAVLHLLDPCVISNTWIAALAVIAPEAQRRIYSVILSVIRRGVTAHSGNHSRGSANVFAYLQIVFIT